MPSISAFFSQPNKACSNLIIQVETLKYLQFTHQGWEVIHGECTRWNICYPQKGPIVMKEFTMAKLAIFNTKVLVFAKPGDMWFFKLLLIWVVIKSVVISVTTPMSCRHAALEPCVNTCTPLDQKLHLIATHFWWEITNLAKEQEQWIWYHSLHLQQRTMSLGQYIANHWHSAF